MTDVIQHVIDAISLGSLFALVSLSVAVIFGVARIVNFANAEMITVAGYAMILTVGMPWPVVVLAAVGAAVLVSLLMDGLVFRWVRNAPPTTLLIVSFGVSYFLQNALLMLEGSRPKTLDFGSSLINSIDVAGVQVSILSLVSMGVTAVLVVGLTWLLRRTASGRQIRAASEDFVMARLLGVKANRVIAYAFAISGALAGIAGVLLTINTATVTPTFGVAPLIVAFVAVVIGGIGSLTGAAVGGLLVGVVSVALQVVLPDPLKPYRDAFVFGLVIALLLVRPQGLLPPAYAKERV
jgi:branched-chain amino acid transport system permease protein